MAHRSGDWDQNPRHGEDHRHRQDAEGEGQVVLYGRYRLSRDQDQMKKLGGVVGVQPHIRGLDGHIGAREPMAISTFAVARAGPSLTPLLTKC